MNHDAYAAEVLAQLTEDLQDYMAQYEKPNPPEGSRQVVLGLMLAEKLIAKRHFELLHQAGVIR